MNSNLRSRRWGPNLSVIEQAALSQMSGRGNLIQRLRGTNGVQAGNRDARQLRPNLTTDAVRYTYDTVLATIPNATPIVWRCKTDEGIQRTDTSIGIGGYVPIAQNPFGGLEWGAQLLPYDPVPVNPNQTQTVLIELLNDVGGVVKSATKDVAFTLGGVSWVATAWTYDTNGPVAEFWQIRVSLTGSFVAPGTDIVLAWILGRVN